MQGKEGSVSVHFRFTELVFFLSLFFCSLLINATVRHLPHGGSKPFAATFYFFFHFYVCIVEEEAEGRSGVRGPSSSVPGRQSVKKLSTPLPTPVFLTSEPAGKHHSIYRPRTHLSVNVRFYSSVLTEKVRHPGLHTL